MDSYSNRIISYQFCGSRLEFQLSLGLFSSNSVDAGSHLLLKTLAKKIDPQRGGTVLDAGCGIGTLGLAVKKAFPAWIVYMQDRDALAVEFTRRNALLNKIEVISETGFLLEKCNGFPSGYDLILSNIPAKAGGSVIKEFLTGAGSLLKPDGMIAAVIVNTLADAAENALLEAGCSISHKESSKQHTVFHYSGFGKQHDASLNPYIRRSGDFDTAGIRYRMGTVYNIPDFDNPGFSLITNVRFLSDLPVNGKALFWNPGQGHLPVCLERKGKQRFETVLLAGRDLLSLRISEKNLGENTDAANRLYPVCAPFFKSLSDNSDIGDIDFLSACFDPVPKSNWYDEVFPTAGKILKNEGLLHLSGSSSDMFSVMKNHKGFLILKDKKSRGTRSVLLKKLQPNTTRC